MTSTITQAWITVDHMNEIVATLMEDNEQFLYMYEREEYIENHNENIIYSTDIPDDNLMWFKKLKAKTE